MGRTLGQIKQDIAELEATTSDVAAELHRLYCQYFQSLSQLARKQLVLASYQICTQVYPESFLNLSFNQRQQLQEDLRELGKQLQPQLLATLKPERSSTGAMNLIEQMLVQPPNDQGEEDAQWLDLTKSEEAPLSQGGVSLTAEGSHPQAQPDTLLDVPSRRGRGLPLQGRERMTSTGATAEVSESEAQENLEDEETEEGSEEPLEIRNPEDLVLWCQGAEQGISAVLEKLSKRANYRLQKAKVLPEQLTAKVVETALQAEDSTFSSHSPNLLNVLVEAESEGVPIAKFTAIRLRLAEIEFADSGLSAQRNELRQLLEKLSRLRQQYRKRQRERAVAEAEAAWRASWYDE